MLRRENINSPNTSLTLVEFGHISFWLLISLQLLYRVMLVPPVEHNELVSRTYPHTPSFWTESLPFQVTQRIGSSSLCYTIGSCWLISFQCLC